MPLLEMQVLFLQKSGWEIAGIPCFFPTHRQVAGNDLHSPGIDIQIKLASKAEV